MFSQRAGIGKTAAPCPNGAAWRVVFPCASFPDLPRTSNLSLLPFHLPLFPHAPDPFGLPAKKRPACDIQPQPGLPV